MSFSAADEQHMRHALTLAARAMADTDPNPRVGCVIVNGNKVVGQGAHLMAGGPHAEVHALREAGQLARGATCYVTLEPCNHLGRTGPCSEALLAAGVRRVVVAMADDNPKARGGLARLRSAGVQVEQGLLADAARELNIGFHQRCATGRPWLRLKLAASLDGRTAAADGSSQWITGAEAREDVQQWRARASIILTGAATVRVDNPRLNVRLAGVGRQPLRVIVSHAFDVAADAHIFDAPGAARIYGLPAGAAPAAAEANCQRLQQAGRDVRHGPVNHDGTALDFKALLAAWARDEEANEIHAEGGALLTGQLLAADVVDEIVLYQAPRLLGDGGYPLARLPGLGTLSQALPFHIHDSRIIGADLRLILRREESACSAD